MIWRFHDHTVMPEHCPLETSDMPIETRLRFMIAEGICNDNTPTHFYNSVCEREATTISYLQYICLEILCVCSGPGYVLLNPSYIRCYKNTFVHDPFSGKINVRNRPRVLFQRLTCHCIKPFVNKTKYLLVMIFFLFGWGVVVFSK